MDVRACFWPTRRPEAAAQERVGETHRHCRQAPAHAHLQINRRGLVLERRKLVAGGLFGKELRRGHFAFVFFFEGKDDIEKKYRW